MDLWSLIISYLHKFSHLLKMDRMIISMFHFVSGVPKMQKWNALSSQGHLKGTMLANTGLQSVQT